MRTAVRRTVGAAVTAVAMAAAGVGVGAAPAYADASIVFVSDSTPDDDDTVMVAGFADTPGNDVSVAECNVTADPVTARACNQTDQDRFAVVTSDSTFGFWAASLVVDDDFTNASFSGLPAIAGDTTCESLAGANGTCAIQAQEYSGAPPNYTPVGGPATATLAF